MRQGMIILVQAFFALTFSVSSLAESYYPTNPDPTLTPGDLCTRPSGYRYPERIAYCERNVSSGRKRQIIEDYNQKLGFEIKRSDRQQFKIDHLIPLCAGGSNDDQNLWPQHKTVYEITDPLEGILCEKMAAGKLLQERAVELILRAKHDLDEAREILALVQSL